MSVQARRLCAAGGSALRAALAGAAAAAGLLAALAEAQALGQLRTSCTVVRRNHRIVRRQTPLFAILFRAQATRGQMPAQSLIGLVVFEAVQCIRRDRLADLRPSQLRTGRGSLFRSAL